MASVERASLTVVCDSVGRSQRAPGQESGAPPAEAESFLVFERQEVENLPFYMYFASFIRGLCIGVVKTILITPI